MRLHVHHVTTYRYGDPALRLSQAYRVWPRSGRSQTVHEWRVKVAGRTVKPSAQDGFGNLIASHAFNQPMDAVKIEVEGIVDTIDTHGIHGIDRDALPPEFFLAPTPLTAPNEAMQALVDAGSSGAGSPVEHLHALSARILEHVRYSPRQTDVASAAADALELGAGVCQDHAHLMAACARLLGHPARYVSGYLCAGDHGREAASHAWAEVMLPELGWVGFDPSNGVSPDPHYVRVAVGRDYADAAPFRGVRMGGAHEELEVHVRVQPGISDQ